jgi:hypothetical protein
MKGPSVKKTIDIRLERDPRYAASKARLGELGGQLAALEKDKADLVAGLNSIGHQAVDAIRAEAQALLSGSQASDVINREKLTRNLEQMTHRIAVLRQAVELQRQIVDDLAGEVSRAICADLLPAYEANVRAVIAAALLLAEQCRIERQLRSDLQSNGVQFTSMLRPMVLSGFDLTDVNSRLSRFLLEAVQFHFMQAQELPESLREHVPPSWTSREVIQPAERVTRSRKNGPDDEWSGA